jgi:hypothetical protein
MFKEREVDSRTLLTVFLCINPKQPFSHHSMHDPLLIKKFKNPLLVTDLKKST